MDLLILGSGSDLYQSDALEDYASSAESDVEIVMETRTAAPAGPDGEAVMRRAYLEGYQNGAVQFTVTPIVDGASRTDQRAILSAPAIARRFAFLAGFGVYHADRSGIRTGLIGTTMQFRVTSTDPSSRWHLEVVTIAFRPIHVARGKDSVE